MRLVLMSDTHLRHEFEVPPGDVLIHAGDITGSGSWAQMVRAADWLRQVSADGGFAATVFVPGNHDWLFERNLARARALFEGITVLVDEAAEVAGLRLYGTPQQPEFCNWAFNRQPAELEQAYRAIPHGLDVLVTHTPPYRILDLAYDRRVGSPELRERVLTTRPRLHVFGHIHGAYGDVQGHYTRFVNAAVCDEGYLPVQAPVVIDLSTREDEDVEQS